MTEGTWPLRTFRDDADDGVMGIPATPRCTGIVVIHHDLSMTCTQDPCSAIDGVHVLGSDAWLCAHVSFYG